ncbi:MAG: hypothetical protein ACYC7L_05055 [Nitrospirota bacterium]
MKQDNANIFTPRVSPRQGLQPTPEELTAFLEQQKKEGYPATLANGISRARMMLIDIEAFEQRRKLEPGLQDLRERMVFGVLRHTRFVNGDLLAAVSQFEYHIHALETIDFESPAEFISNAERTLKKLKRSSIDHVLRMARLTEMVEERRNILIGCEARWAALTGELRHIVDYVRENLQRIETLCRKSIVVLVEIGLEKKKENELIGEVRDRFLQELKDSTGVRQLTADDLAKVKGVCDRLSKKLSEMIRDDQYSLSWLYEVVHDRAKAIMAALDGILNELVRLVPEQRREALLLYRKIGQALVSLVADFPAELRPGKVDVGATRNALLMEKRRDMLDHLLDQAGLERRERSDRRARQERRRDRDLNYAGPERRAAERRTRAGRRAR